MKRIDFVTACFQEAPQNLLSCSTDNEMLAEDVRMVPRKLQFQCPFQDLKPVSRT